MAVGRMCFVWWTLFAALPSSFPSSGASSICATPLQRLERLFSPVALCVCSLTFVWEGCFEHSQACNVQELLFVGRGVRVFHAHLLLSVMCKRRKFAFVTLFFGRFVAMLPFGTTWLMHLMREGATVAFFVVVGSWFAPESENPLLKVYESDEEVSVRRVSSLGIAQVSNQGTDQ